MFERTSVGFGLVLVDLGKGLSGLCSELDAVGKLNNSMMEYLTKSCLEGGKTRMRFKAISDKEAVVTHISQMGDVCSFCGWDNIHEFVCVQM